MKYRKSIRICLFLLISCLVIHANASAKDYYFTAVDSVQAPLSGNLTQYHIYDMNNDGFDDIILSALNGYYIYSFASDSELLIDTSHLYGISGLVPTKEYDADPDAEILIFDSYQLFLQDGLGAPNRIHLANVFGIDWASGPANLYFGDADDDNQKELIAARRGVYFEGDNRYREYFSGGNIFFINAVDWITEWEKVGFYCWALCHPIAANALFADLDKDDKIEIITWGLYYHDWCYRKLDEFGGDTCGYDSAHVFDIYDCYGRQLTSTEANGNISVLAGMFCAHSLGDVAIILKDGQSFDSNSFVPSSQYGLYCLGVVDDSIEMLWAKDASALEKNMFYMPGFSNTFCTSTSDNQYSLRSGDDGSIIGAIYGLQKGLKTEEGHFLPLDDSIIQLVQVDGNKAYLYKLVSTVDVEEANPPNLPAGFFLYQNSPNPFNPSTTIEFDLPSGSEISLEIFNILGRRITTLSKGFHKSGHYSIKWNGNDNDGRSTSSGLYLCRLKTEDSEATIKMVKLQ